jgi:glycosyltransferase involved in cell wall biosynthesis
VRTFGIYLAYEPTVDLRAEGLGRLLGALLGAATRRADIRFVIACPSWSRESIRDLLLSEGIDPARFEYLGPSQKPALLRLYEHWLRWRARERGRQWRRWLAALRRGLRVALGWAGVPRRKLVSTRSYWPLAAAVAAAIGGAILLLPFLLLGLAGKRLRNGLGAKPTPEAPPAPSTRTGLETALRRLIAGHAPKEIPPVVALFQEMQQAELLALEREIARAPWVEAWYCPTAFWPAVTRLPVPVLVCVPDIVPLEFPVAFSRLGGERVRSRIKQIRQTLRGARHLVVYSEHVRAHTLNQQLGLNPQSVAVIPHGASRLDRMISVRGDNAPPAATDAFAWDLVQRAMRRCGIPSNAPGLSDQTRYLFYASQFRPNKNLVNLLRAIEFLLRQRYVSCKLVLTGNVSAFPEIGQTIARLRLHNEVLIVPGLSSQELAAFYRRATLAVNPSLFEGGVPFTYSEALCVGTPVVMARVPPTLEAIDDPDLRRDMLFDPYDVRDMAARLQWALANRAELLERQTEHYSQTLALRSWDQVLEEYLGELKQIARTMPESAGVRV